LNGDSMFCLWHSDVSFKFEKTEGADSLSIIYCNFIIIINSERPKNPIKKTFICLITRVKHPLYHWILDEKMYKRWLKSNMNSKKIEVKDKWQNMS
jgi:hypothetical protein